MKNWPQKMLLQVSSDCRDSTQGMSFEKMYAWAEWGLERFEEETLEAPCFLQLCLVRAFEPSETPVAGTVSRKQRLRLRHCPESSGTQTSFQTWMGWSCSFPSACDGSPSCSGQAVLVPMQGPRRVLSYIPHVHSVHESRRHFSRFCVIHQYSPEL